MNSGASAVCAVVMMVQARCGAGGGRRRWTREVVVGTIGREQGQKMSLTPLSTTFYGGHVIPPAPPPQLPPVHPSSSAPRLFTVVKLGVVGPQQRVPRAVVVVAGGVVMEYLVSLDANAK